jgi:hypothetical protein
MGGDMHVHANAPVRTFLVTLMDDTLPTPRTHMIKVESPCDCDMREFVSSIPDLPFKPVFMHVMDETTAVPATLGE